MVTYTVDNLTQITGEIFEQTDINNFNSTLAAHQDGDIDTHLIGLTTEQQWGVYEIASSLDIAHGDNHNIINLDTLRVINWVALSAKAAGQGHLIHN